MNFNKEELVSAVLLLFKTHKEIKICANKYNDDSIKILSHFGKKCRQNDNRNQKLLYKMWNDETVQKNIQEMFEHRLRETTAEDETIADNVEDEVLSNNVGVEFVENDMIEQATNDGVTSEKFIDQQVTLDVKIKELAKKSQPSDNESRDTEIFRLLTTIRQKDQEIDKLNSCIEDLKMVNESLKNENSILHQEVDKYVQLSDAQTLANELESKLSKANEKVEVLEKELSEFRQDAEITLELSKPEVDVELNETKQLQLKIESLLKLISTKDEELDKIKKTNVNIEENLEISLQNGNAVRGKLSELEEQDGGLEHKMALCEQTCDLLLPNDEDIIRCICGIFTDVNEIVQCHKCMVWQHIECTGASVNDRSYLCEQCDQRVVDPEIPLDEYTDKGYRYYLTLMRGALRVHLTDTVYVLRDISIAQESTSTTSPIKKHTYKTIQKFDCNTCDIFRVEHLWKDQEGNRFVFGYNYLRPNETFHEPNKKFYKNEIIRVPVYEVLPIELIMGRCWVLDSTTFCKGRPVDCEESHVYICDLKTDKGRRVFSKIIRKHPICTKPYAFQKFEQKLKITRDFAPQHNTKLKKKKTDDDSNPTPSKAPRMQQ